MTRSGSWEQFHTYIRWNHVPPAPPSVPMPAAYPAPAAGSVVVTSGRSVRPRSPSGLVGVLVSSVALLFQCLRKRGP